MNSRMLVNLQLIIMLGGVTKRLLNGISNAKQGLYNISRKSVQPPNYLKLYQSSVFTTSNFADIFKSSESSLRYKQLLPILITSQTGLYPNRYLYTSLSFDPNNETLKIVTLRANSFLTQQFRLNNIIPWSYRDMMAQSKLPEPTYPVFIDDQMVYFNKFANETLFAESDGKWNQQTVAHEKLSLNSHFNQKEWFDRQQLF